MERRREGTGHTFFTDAQSVTFSNSLIGTMLPETTDFIFSSTISDKSSGESIRTTKTSVFVSETPYLRMASVIWTTIKRGKRQRYKTHIVCRVQIIQNLGMYRPRSQPILRVSNDSLMNSRLQVQLASDLPSTFQRSRSYYSMG